MTNLIEKRMRVFLWEVVDENKKEHLIKVSCVIVSNAILWGLWGVGGLGIGNLILKNRALLANPS